MSKLFGVKLIRFLLIAFSASMAGVAILDVQSANYSGALISVGVSLLLFIDALNPQYFIRTLSGKTPVASNNPSTASTVTKAPVNYKVLAAKFAWTLILIGIAAKLYVFLFLK